MGKAIEDLEVLCYEWPDRFFVEAECIDRDYTFFFPMATPEIYPHFVDLGIYEAGWCDCRDFRFSVEPYLSYTGPHRLHCIHLIAARRYRNLLGTKPKPLCLKLFPVVDADTDTKPQNLGAQTAC